MTRPGWLGSVVAVLRKDLRLLFLSPTAWAFLTSFLVLGGLFFTLSLAWTGEASLRPSMSNLGVTLVFCIPLVTMRLLAEERRSGTLELLLTAPVPLSALVLGKWLAALGLCAVLLALTTPWVAVLAIYGDPDPGAVCTSYLGLLACCGAFSAAGLLASSLTRDPMAAGIGGVVLVLPSWLASSARELVPEASRPWLDRVSFLEHLRSFAQGVLDTGDIAWFAACTALLLFATWQVLEAARWR